MLAVSSATVAPLAFVAAKAGITSPGEMAEAEPAKAIEARAAIRDFVKVFIRANTVPQLRWSRELAFKVSHLAFLVLNFQSKRNPQIQLFSAATLANA